MAYVAGDKLLIVRGNLANGEVWANTWAVSGLDTGDVQDAVDGLRVAYNGWLPGLSDQFNATSCDVRDLFLGIPIGASWATNTGSASGATLPNECAIRVSLTGALGVRGGPFLAGWATDAMTDDGNLTGSQAGTIVTNIVAWQDDVLASFTNPAHIGINRPTTDEVVDAFQVRVGEVFDVIRRRRSAISENYHSGVFA